MRLIRETGVESDLRERPVICEKPAASKVDAETALLFGDTPPIDTAENRGNAGCGDTNVGGNLVESQAIPEALAEKPGDAIQP